jgi:hypothetical protein
VRFILTAALVALLSGAGDAHTVNALGHDMFDLEVVEVHIGE